MNFYKSFKEFENIFEETWKYYLCYMKELAEILNNYHQTNYSIRYWEMIAGKWVWDYLMLLYARYKFLDHVSSAKKENGYKDESIRFLEGENLRFVCYNSDLDGYMVDCIMKFKHEYNQKKNESIEINNVNVDKKNNFKCEFIDYEQEDAAVQEEYKYLLDEESTWLFSKTLKANKITILKKYNFEYEKLCVNKSLRKKIFCRKKRTEEFEYIFWNSLVGNLPKIYLEEYSIIKNGIFDYYPRKKFRYIYVFDYLDYSDFLCDFYIAIQVECFNAKLVSIQHGGGYGMNKYNSFEFFERHISDLFVSWGWKGINVIDMPCLLHLKNKRRILNIPNRYQGVLYLTTAEMQYIGFFNGISSMLQPEKYQQDISRFLGYLLSKSEIEIEWRSYRSRLSFNGENQVDRVIAYLSSNMKLTNLIIDVEGTFYSRLKKCRVVVLDYCSTTFLETISNNIPTILFWDKDINELTNEAENMLKKMENVGIFHSTPESAAEFIKINYNSIEVWWQSDAVQKVVSEFTYNYARRDDNIILSYVKLFKTGNKNCILENNNIDVVTYSKYKDIKYMVFIAKHYIRKLLHKIKNKLRSFWLKMVQVLTERYL